MVPNSQSVRREHWKLYPTFVYILRTAEAEPGCPKYLCIFKVKELGVIERMRVAVSPQQLSRALQDIPGQAGE